MMGDCGRRDRGKSGASMIHRVRFRGPCARPRRISFMVSQVGGQDAELRLDGL